MYSPIGVIEVSAPRVKSPIPTIIIIAPIRNARNIDDGTGINVARRNNTIKVTGRTDDSDSFIFSDKIVLFRNFICSSFRSLYSLY